MNRPVDPVVLAPDWQQLGFRPGHVFRVFGMRQLNTLDLPRNARRMVAQLIRNSQSLFVSDKGAL